MNVTEKIERFWIDIGLLVKLDGLGDEALIELARNVDDVSDALLNVESVIGEILSRASFWPKDKGLAGTEISVLGSHVANMAGLREFILSIQQGLQNHHAISLGGEREIDFAATPGHNPDPTPGGVNE